jgi:quercetin dioxygenase-like cupin family protein
MAERPDDRVHDEERLDGFWNELVAGKPAPATDLDPSLIDVVRRFHRSTDVPGPDAAFVDRLMEELMETTVPAAPVPRLPSIPPNGRVARPRTRWSSPVRPAAPRGWLVTQLATAALLLLTLLGIYFAFLHDRFAADGPTGVPGLAGSPVSIQAPPAVLRETIVDTVFDPLPQGKPNVFVERWHFKPGPATFTQVPIEEPQVLAVTVGTIVGTFGGMEQTLTAGHQVVVPAGQGVILRNPDPAVEAELFFILITPDYGVGEQHDPAYISADNPIASFATSLPGGPGRVVLERLTVPPGASLPPEESTGAGRIGIESGRLGLTFEGENLLRGWQPGQEQEFWAQSNLLVFRPGTRMTIRNAGDDTLVLYRVMITPLGSGTPTGTPVP